MPEPYTPRHAARLHARDRRDTALREARLKRAARKSAAFDAYTKAIEPLRDAYFAECDAADSAYDETLSEVAAWYGGAATASTGAAGGAPGQALARAIIAPLTGDSRA